MKFLTSARIKNSVLRFGVALAMVAGTNAALAAPQYCEGTVLDTYVDSDGNLQTLPSWAPSYVMLCNVNQTTGGVSATTCLTWFSIIKSAQTRQSKTLFFYSNAPACNQMPTYSSAPTPGYVMMEN